MRYRLRRSHAHSTHDTSTAEQKREPFFQHGDRGARKSFFRAGPTVSRAPEAAIMRQEAPRVRIPALEIAGMQFGGSLAGPGRRLTGDERRAAALVFQASINVDAVRVVETPIISAPTTLGNYIRIQPGSTMSLPILVHELAHIWQFQTKGNAYISDSAFHQAAAAITTGDRGAAYRVEIVPNKSIHQYTAEQQAMIIQNWYASPELRADPEYARLIGEVRSSTPSLTDMDRYIESLYGSSPQRSGPATGPSESGATVPGNILRIEF